MMVMVMMMMIASQVPEWTVALEKTGQYLSIP
jgi:hypothetical protein